MFIYKFKFGNREYIITKIKIKQILDLKNRRSTKYTVGSIQSNFKISLRAKRKLILIQIKSLF